MLKKVRIIPWGNSRNSRNFSDANTFLRFSDFSDFGRIFAFFAFFAFSLVFCIFSLFVSFYQPARELDLRAFFRFTHFAHTFFIYAPNTHPSRFFTR
jgi:hypothetical protein